MGNPNSKSSFKNNNSVNSNEIDFVSSKEYTYNKSIDSESKCESNVLTNFTWNYGGNTVLLTGSFNRWKVMLPMERNADEFSITLLLPRGVHQYKFIVDGEWRFSPEDPTMPDINGHINNYIDTTNFQPLVDPDKYTFFAEGRKNELNDTSRPIFEPEQGPGKVIKQFNKQAPKLPPHYEECEYLQKSRAYIRVPLNEEMREKSEEQSLTQEEIQFLFKTSHCLPMPTHVTLDHLVLHEDKGYSSMTVTQRFKQKYTTFTHYSIKDSL